MMVLMRLSLRGKPSNRVSTSSPSGVSPAVLRKDRFFPFGPPGTRFGRTPKQFPAHRSRLLHRANGWRPRGRSFDNICLRTLVLQSLDIRRSTPLSGSSPYVGGRHPERERRIITTLRERNVAELAKVTIEVAGRTATIIADAKQFKTGSRGFYGQGKVEGTDGRRFQVSVNIVEIGSKGKAQS